MLQQLNYRLVLYALLHDIGKPVLRFSLRYIEGIERGELAEKARQLLESFLGERVKIERKIESLAKRKHEEISEDVVKALLGTSLSDDERRFFSTAITEVDRFAASERGIELEKELYEKVKKLWDVVENELGKRLGTRYRYSHHVVPMLSPLWVLVKTDYLSYVGIPAYLRGVAGKWQADKARKRFAEFFKGYKLVAVGSEREFVESVVETIQSLADEELWLPVRSLNLKSVFELKALKLLEAVNQSSYADVVANLVNGLTNVSKIYGSSIGRGAVDTVLSILRSSVALVPSAIYWSLLPDISLYSHSKLVAAYTACKQLSTKARLLVIDANRIQKFISSPIVAAAASRVIRGRSLLVELALDSLANYALKLFGGLTQANVVVSEGGTLDLVVPDLPDVDTTRVPELRRVAKRLSRFLGGELGFTIAISEPFEIERSRFHDTVVAMLEGRGAEGGFWKVLEDVRYKLAVEKSRGGIDEEDVGLGGVVAEEKDVIGFDALTGEPIALSRAGTPVIGGQYVLKVSQEIKDYVDGIAGPDKLLPGEVIGTATHLSLVAGTAARYLLYIVGIHVYRRDSRGVAVPAEDVVVELVKKICEKLHRDSSRLFSNKLGTDVGVVPLEPSGSIYVLISAPEMLIATPKEATSMFDPEELAPITIKYLLRVIDNLKEVLLRYAGSEEGLDIHVDIEFVNLPYASTSMSKELIESIKELINKGVDVAIDFRFLGSYHPVWLAKETQNGGGRPVLADIEPYEIIAVAKMDMDMFGKVRELLACSPSRLVTLSDLVNAVVSGKAYAYAIAKQKDLAKLQKVLDVIPLYAGGDDVTIYGKWAQVVRYVVDVLKSIRDALKPLTASVGIAIDRSTAPILMLYSRAVEVLERAKKVKASASIDIEVEHLNVFRCDGNTYKAVDVIPLEPPSRYYPMPSDDASLYNLGVVAEIFDVFPNERGEILKKLTEFEEFKRDLYLLAEIGSEVLKVIRRSPEDVCRPLKDLVLYPDKMLSLEILYSYTWARRDKELAKLKNLLNNYGLKLLKYPDDIVGRTSVLEALRLLLSLKPVVDLVVLALRRREAVEPSSFVQVKR